VLKLGDSEEPHTSTDLMSVVLDQYWNAQHRKLKWQVQHTSSSKLVTTEILGHLSSPHLYSKIPFCYENPEG